MSSGQHGNDGDGVKVAQNGNGKRLATITSDPVEGLTPLGELPASERVYLSDGSNRDVTRLTVFSSSDPNIASVNANGLVEFTQSGEVAILCRYLDELIGVRTSDGAAVLVDEACHVEAVIDISHEGPELQPERFDQAQQHG